MSTAHSSIFIAETPGSSGDGVFCSPPQKGTSATCVFYIAVVAGGGDGPPMQLTATADVLSGVSLVSYNYYFVLVFHRVSFFYREREGGRESVQKTPFVCIISNRSSWIVFRSFGIFGTFGTFGTCTCINYV